jgi:prepilin-type N-terminal cleavage/methylation domain-containing protein
MVKSPRSRSHLRRSGFSILELLMALTISASLLTAALVALDTMFKRYEVIGNQASTNVVARTVMHRVLAMIRQGREFGPYPVDPTDSTQNPFNSDRLEFVSKGIKSSGTFEVTTLEVRAAATVTISSEQVKHRGPNVLWMTVTPFFSNSPGTAKSFPLLDGITACTFNLDYDPGPRLMRATVDMTVLPTGNEFQRDVAGVKTSDVTDQSTQAIATDAVSDTIRFVASTSPRGQMD